MEYLHKVNNEIPKIFKKIVKKYKLKHMRINGLNSAFVKDNYAIIMSVDRDYVDINFLYRDGTKIIKYWLQPFLIENLDDEDRSVQRVEKDFNTKLINYILLYEKTLSSKWQSILMGQMDWVERYNEKTYMRAIRELNEEEYNNYKGIFGL